VEKSICINGVEKRLGIETKDGAYQFSIDGKHYVVTAEALTNGSIAFFAGSRSYVAHVTRGESGLKIALGGGNFSVAGETDDGGRRSGPGGSAHSDGRIQSPMPGNIIAVNVKVGDDVAVDQAVVVIESMKMQNEIASPVAGRVAKVSCSVGDQVNFGQILVEIAPEEPEA
jgi:biotin carboxyl carrier protein